MLSITVNSSDIDVKGSGKPLELLAELTEGVIEVLKVIQEGKPINVKQIFIESSE